MISVFLPLVLAASLWSPLGWRCAEIGPVITMRCTASALLGPAMRGPATFSADVRAAPAADGRVWASLALNGDVERDNRYASVGITAGIDPFRYLSNLWGVLLVEQPTHANAYELAPVGDGWHRLRVEYDGQGLIKACVDGVCEQAAIELTEVQPELICMGVDKMEPGENVATCEFRGVRVD